MQGNVSLTEPAHDKAYNKTLVTSDGFDQSAQPRSMSIVFADRMCFLQPPGYPKEGQTSPIAILGECTGCSESLLVT